MSDPCCASFGGRILLDVDGVRYSAVGDVTVYPSNVETEAEANQDGTAAFKVKPVLPGFEVVFRHNCGFRWNDSMRKCVVNATIAEADNGRTHFFTGCRLVGTPAVNLSSGEVSGLSARGPKYRLVQ